MEALALLTPERREELKTLPPWFLQRFRDAVQSQKDAQAGLEAEQGRLAKFEQLASEWEANLKAEHDRLISIQRSRLDEAMQEVEQWKSEEQKRHSAIYRVVDDQVDAKKLELAQAQGLAEKRREQLMTLRRQIEDLQESTRLKKEQLTALEQQKAPKTVRSRFESTVRKRLGSVSAGAQTPATLPPAPLNGQNMPSSANPIDENPASNTPDTALDISSVDIDYVPPHSIYESLEELLSHTDFKLLAGISEGVPASDQEKLARILAAYYDSTGRILDALDFLMKEEVKRTLDVATLFRSNSLASRMMSAYARSIGLSYCKLVLKDTIDKIVAANENLEVDPIKYAEAENMVGYSFSIPKEKLQANTLRIMEYASEFLTKIFQSSHLAPVEFHEVAALMKESVIPKFPGEWKLAIGGFLFLRIICPCIYRPPDEFGTDFASYPDRAKRTLVIVAKIMQNLANYVPKFGEDSMAVFSDYVQQNIPNVDAYFARMAEIPRGKPVSASPEYDKRTILRDLIGLMKVNSTKILERVTTAHNQSFTQKWRFAKAPKFASTVNRLGTPVETLKYQSSDPNVDSFLTQLTVDDGTIVKCLLNVMENLNVGGADEDFFADVMLQCFESRARGALLIIAALQVFVETSQRKDKVISDSFAAKTFMRWSSILCRDKLREIIIPHLPGVMRSMNDVNRRDILMQVTEPILVAMIESIPQLPSPLWKVCDFIAKNPNLGEKVVIQFLFSFMFQRILEQPDTFQIVQGEIDRTLRKALLMISDMIANVVYNREDRNNPDLSFFIMEHVGSLRTSLATWLGKNPGSVGPLSYPINWDALEKCIFYVHKFTFSHMSQINFMLDSAGSDYKWVKFQLREIVHTFVKIESLAL